MNADKFLKIFVLGAPTIVIAYMAFCHLTYDREQDIYAESKNESIESDAFIEDYCIISDTVWVVKGEKCVMPVPKFAFIEKKRQYRQKSGLLQYFKTTIDTAYRFTLIYPKLSPKDFDLYVRNYPMPVRHFENAVVASKLYYNMVPDTVHTIIRDGYSGQYEVIALKKKKMCTANHSKMVRQIIYVDSLWRRSRM